MIFVDLKDEEVTCNPTYLSDMYGENDMYVFFSSKRKIEMFCANDLISYCQLCAI